MLLLAIIFIYTIISSLLSQSNEKILFCIFIITIIAVRVFYGYYGNALYYRVIKHRIKNGYHLLDEYQPTSMILAASIKLATFIGVLLLPATDWLTNNYSRRISGNTEINDENIAAYLNPNREFRSIFTTICNILLFFAILASLFSQYKGT